MSEVTPDNSRDVQESVERTREAEAYQYEALKRKYGPQYVNRLKAERERKRDGRIKANERRLDELEAQQGIIRGKTSRLTVYHE